MIFAWKNIFPEFGVLPPRVLRLCSKHWMYRITYPNIFVVCSKQCEDAEQGACRWNCDRAEWQDSAVWLARRRPSSKNHCAVWHRHDDTRQKSRQRRRHVALPSRTDGGLCTRRNLPLYTENIGDKTVVRPTFKIKHLQNICKNVLVFYFTCNQRKTFAKHLQKCFRGGSM